jgi:hypothetical protein
MIHHKYLILISAVIGLIPIVLGIISLATPIWINIKAEFLPGSVSYGLFQQCITTEETRCIKVSTLQTAQGLEIAGVVILTGGIIIAITLKLFFSKRNIYLISPLLPVIGSILILIGFLIYAKSVIEHLTGYLLEVNIGYSMILMVIACIFGFVATAHLSFNAGYIYINNRQVIHVS